MAVDIVIPSAGESVTSGVISKWLKADGDTVKRDEAVLELETDKVTMEVPAPAAGTIKRTAKEGDTVAIGAVVGTIDESAAGAAPAKATVAAAAGSPAPAPAATASAAAATAVVGNGHAAGEDVRATPLARKLAQEHGVDLGRVSGTGAGGRVREQDVMAFVQSAPAKAAPAPKAEATKPDAAKAEPAKAAPVRAGARGVTRERMSPLRQRIATRLVQAQHTAAMLTTFNEADMTAVMDLRKQLKEEFEKKHGIGLGFMSFFVKAAVNALRAFPLVNASIVEDEQGQPAIEKHDYCDIAVAVSTPKGLVVPVLRNCETLSFAKIESGIKDLATRARDGKLTLDEMQGGTFTITNGGIFGSLLSTPILNPPQSAILGMHTIKNRAVEHPVGSGQVGIRPMMNLAVSYDHRIIDGSEAVQFLVRIKQAIEDPQRLMLDL
jgi:2-oxoglutarate dehydrogenase E2 component (dihydrolipoamide succinyltransferase)